MYQLTSYWQFRVTDCPTWLAMSGWSWITFWATPDPVEKIRKQSWNNEQNNVEITLILDPYIYKPNWNHKMLAFLQPSFPPQVPLNHHMPVWSPFTLNIHTDVWEHPYQRRWRPGTPRGDWRVAWGMDSPAQMCLILPQAERSVSLIAWEHIYIAPGFLVTLPQNRKWGLTCRSTTWSVHRWKKSQFSSVTQSYLTLCDPMDCSRPGLPVHHHIPELTQSHVHWVSDAIQPSHPLSSPSPPAFNLSQHQDLFKWVSFSNQVVKVLEFQLQYQSFQWIFKTGFL